MNTLEGIIEDVEKSDLVSKKVIDKVIELIGQEKWQELNDKEGNTITTTGELLITLKEIPYLEKQIEKMKCCGNCNKMFCNEQDKKECGYNYKYWELRV